MHSSLSFFDESSNPSSVVSLGKLQTSATIPPPYSSLAINVSEHHNKQASRITIQGTDLPKEEINLKKTFNTILEDGKTPLQRNFTATCLQGLLQG